jgi:branched-chain amino acid transport system permease protein
MTALWQYILSGLSVGCTYAMIALALVVVANVTGVFNFATGDYVMFGGIITAVTQGAGWGIWLSVVASVAAVTGFAILQERLTVAPVRGKVGPLGLVIATLGVGVALRGAVLLIWGQNARSALPFQSGNFHLFGAALQNQVKWVFLTTILLLLAVNFLFARTDVGRAMRASAINPIAARLTGIRIGTTSLAAFAIAGALCGLIAAVSAPIVLVQWNAGITIGLIGFIAAALAGFTSPVRAVIAGLALGVIEAVAAGEISSSYNEAIVYGTLVVYLLARDLYGSDGIVSRMLKRRSASSAGSQDAPELRARIRARVHAVEDQIEARMGGHAEAASNGSARLVAAAKSRISVLTCLPIVLLILAAFFPSTTSNGTTLDTANFILFGAMAATGLGLVLGLAGQFSLGQGAFVLLSAYTAAILTGNHGWNPLVALVVAVVAAVVVGAIVGWMTLRLEGLNLALVTLAILEIALVFAVQDTGLTGGTTGINNVPIFKVFGKSFQSPKSFYLLSLVVLAVLLLIARNVWRSRMGRTLRAIGIDQEAAESVGLNAFRLKLKVFVLGAAMAGVAGALWTYYLGVASPDTWGVALAIDLVTYVVVGGVISPFGGAVGAVVVGVIQYEIQRSLGTGSAASSWLVVLSGALLIFFILFFRNGLAAIPQLIADWIHRRRGRGPAPEEVSDTGIERLGVTLAPELAAPPERAATGALGAADLAAGPEVGAAAVASDGRNGADGAVDRLQADVPLVVVENLTRRFGGFTAVDGVSFSMRPGHITALIGPNGAGKSTVINMLAGTLVPSDGAVGIMGRPALGLPPNEIAELGLARTFQTPRLFEGMTLLETVMLARDRFGSRSWLFGTALKTPRAMRDERQSREQALAWLAYLGLAEDAAVPATSLTTGKQRLAELARALATEPTVLLLDEPAAGLDGRETEILADVIRRLAYAGMAILLVEHDMSMVMSIADHVVVLEQGRKIAEGTAAEVGQDQAVVEAYLGVAHA